MTGPDALQRLAQQFIRFAERECLPSSPLYYELSRTVANDEHLLALAGEARVGQPAPNLLFAATHFILARSPVDRLASCYPSLSNDPLPPTAAPPLFREFCRSRRKGIVDLLHTRSVGTNEVARCACLLPAFVEVAGGTGSRIIDFIEIGASAGLNLLWPRYGYDYGGGRIVRGEVGAPTIRCELKGGDPRLELSRARIGRIDGVDLLPMDVSNRDDADWLWALVWPEQHDRRARLLAAIAFARRMAVTVERGDGIETVPAFAAGLPDGDALCVVHSFTLNQIPERARNRLDDQLAAISRSRPTFRVGMEWEAEGVTVNLFRYAPEPERRLLAHADAHGAWLDWLA